MCERSFIVSLLKFRIGLTHRLLGPCLVLLPGTRLTHSLLSFLDILINVSSFWINFLGLLEVFQSFFMFLQL